MNLPIDTTLIFGDYHKRLFVYRALNLATGESRKGSFPTSAENLKELFESFEGPVTLTIEATRGWEWVYDLCLECKVGFHLIDTNKTPGISRSVKKSDERDVEALEYQFMATGTLPASYKASFDEREFRALTRHLHKLRGMKQSLLQRIHALIDSNNYPAAQKYFYKRSWRKEAISHLSPDSFCILQQKLALLDLLCKQKSALEKRLEEKVKGVRAYEILISIPGIHLSIGVTILGELCTLDRFRRSKSFCAFSGLAPSVRGSAGKVQIGKITRRGPKALRWALTQAILGAVRSKTPSPHKSLYLRLIKRNKPKLVARCAAARKLACLIHTLLERDELFDPNPKRKNQNSKERQLASAER